MANFPSIEPFLPYKKEPVTKTLVTDFGDGTRERVTKWTGKYIWDLSFEVDATDLSTLRTFFLARIGKSESFSFTCYEDSQTYTVWFDQDSLPYEQSDNLKYRLNIRLVNW